MITFLPYPSYQRSVGVLDRQRLGHQRLEVLSILRALDRREGPRTKWHPVDLMWEGYPFALAAYGLVVCEEWEARGYQDSVAERIADVMLHGDFVLAEGKVPPWFGDEAFHHSHRANLVQKDPEYYARFFGPLEPTPYVWPVRRVTT